MLCSLTLFGQKSITASLIKTIDFNVDTFVGTDNFGTLYSIKDNTLNKTQKNKTQNYSNLQLGSIFSVNPFNPLKINVFYKQFNTVIILDNRLAEVSKIDFNTLENYKNASHISTGADNTLWLFNQDTRQLELYDYKINKTRVKTLPITSKILGITSNYNACWVLTKSHLLQYNYTGSLLCKIKNNLFTSFSEHHNQIVLRSKNNLYLFNEEHHNFHPIVIPSLLINQFFVTNEILYIYTTNKLYQYQLNLD